MPYLISTLNSGESLEKAAVLSKLALEYNKGFYLDYNTISLYYPNLPRKEDSLQVHGTLGGLIKNLEDKRYLKYKNINNLWEDREDILKKFYDLKIISENLKSKLLKDKSRFEKLVLKMPWYLILEDFKNFLISDFLGNDRIKLEYLDFKKNIREIFKNTAATYDGLMKYYLLNPDGRVSSKILWKESLAKRENLSIKEEKQIIHLENSIVLSPNVFTFLLTFPYSYKDKEEPYFVGYRDFKRIKRIAYDKGIKSLKWQEGFECVEEPKNKLFNDLLDDVDKEHKCLLLEEKVSKAIYRYLNRVL